MYVKGFEREVARNILMIIKIIYANIIYLKKTFFKIDNYPCKNFVKYETASRKPSKNTISFVEAMLDSPVLRLQHTLKKKITKIFLGN